MPKPADWIDPLFTQPFIDVDEWRDAPARHRYVHGGFKGTDALFAIYFPPKEGYEGRFFQHLKHVSGDELYYGSMRGENDDLGFSLAGGAYFVESNLGKKDMYPDTDPTVSELVSFRTSAAVAKFSRRLAADMYGAHRPFGYVFGGSGGAYKTVGCIEATTGVWDGAVPYIMGSVMSLPCGFTVMTRAFRVLKDKAAAIVDATEPGGGDMYAGLNAEEQAALREFTLMGFPPRTWYAHAQIGSQFSGVFASLIQRMYEWDPTYFKDFWTVPGYLGADPPESLKLARVRHETSVVRVVMSDEARNLGLPLAISAAQRDIVPAALQLASLPSSGDLQGSKLRVTSGAAAGHDLYLIDVVGGLVTVSFGPEAFKFVNGLKPGDQLTIDNADWLAAQTYHRHQVPDREFYPWDQYRGPDGQPLYPQRSLLLGQLYTKTGGAITLQCGRFTGKMILLQCMMDEAAYPWNADWYRTRVKAALGPRLDDNFRLWYFDRAMHGAPRSAADRTHIVDYMPAVHQALRDLAAWVERGVPPARSTNYRIVDSQVVVPASAAERMGVQPIVTLTANGAVRADVRVGEPVELAALIDLPDGAGRLTSLEWSRDGEADYAAHPLTAAERSVRRTTLTTSHTFHRAGVYFPTVRITSQRPRMDGDRYGKLQNLDRVRVVVT